jgi:hypothetical protein
MSQPITVVCGLPRSGTTLMMSMLHAGGMEVCAENLSSFETMKATKLPKDSTWLSECYGVAVKILDPLNYTPPQHHRYKFIWMRRTPVQVAQSQIKFISATGTPIDPKLGNVIRIANAVEHNTRKSIDMLCKYKESDLIVIDFEDVLHEPCEVADKVAEFVDMGLDRKKMADAVIDRPPDCYKGMLELDLIGADA